MASEQFYVTAASTCKTSNIVYLVECRKGKKKYVHVGETEKALHLRFKWPLIRVLSTTRDKPVAVHFNLTGHTFNNLTVMVIKHSLNLNA